MAESKGWTERTTVEVRRQACQKVAAWLLPLLSSDGKGSWEQYIEIVDALSDDVIAAGDRAEQPRANPMPTAAPDGFGVPEKIDKRLTEPQQEKMLKFLNENVALTPEGREGQLDRNVFDLKLYSLGLPKGSHKDIVRILTKEQAQFLHAFIKERLESATTSN